MTDANPAGPVSKPPAEPVPAEPPREKLAERPSKKPAEQPREEIPGQPHEELLGQPREKFAEQPREEVLEPPGEELLEPPHQELSEQPREMAPEPPRDQPAESNGRTEPWAKIIADPGHAPELLALAAVEIFGPRAHSWATRTRDSYPNAGDRALARLATRQFTRFGGLGSIFGAVAGSYAPITLLGTAAVTQAELVLHIAAAYGLDPTAPERAADLLVITRVHPTHQDAEAALESAKRPAYEDGGLTGAAWRLGRMLAAQTGGWTALRLANRFFPGTSLLAAVLTSTASAQSVAARADAYYRKMTQTQVSQDAGSSV